MSCCGSCILVAFCLCFCFTFRLFAPGHVLEKFSWCQVFVFFWELLLRIIFWARTFIFRVFLFFIFSGVLPLFLLYVSAFRSRTRIGKILLMSGFRFFLRVAFENKFSRANFYFSCLLAFLIFSGVLPLFLLYVSAFRSRTRFGKILLMSGPRLFVHHGFPPFPAHPPLLSVFLPSQMMFFVSYWFSIMRIHAVSCEIMPFQEESCNFGSWYCLDFPTDLGRISKEERVQLLFVCVAPIPLISVLLLRCATVEFLKLSMK